MKVLDYSESFFSGNIGNFRVLPYSDNLKIEEFQKSNCIISYPDGRLVICHKLYVECQMRMSKIL